MCYKLIQTTAIESVTEVRFYDETVEKIASGHPEVPILLPSVVGAVATAVSAPTSVKKSKTHEKSYVYVDAGTTNEGGDPLHVPVRVVGSGTSARVTSAYFAELDDDETIYRRET